MVCWLDEIASIYWECEIISITILPNETQIVVSDRFGKIVNGLTGKNRENY